MKISKFTRTIESPRTIGLVGGIAVGKTTFGRNLAKVIPNSQYCEEDVSKNPYLDIFYKDMKTWGFHSRIAFLAMKAQVYREIGLSSDCIIIDRPLHESIIFAELQYKLGNLTDDDYNTYYSLYQSLVSMVPRLDCLIYVHCSIETSLERIRERGRQFEQKVDDVYLRKIQSRYEEWLSTLNPDKVIRINTDKLARHDTITAETVELIKQCLSHI